MSDWCEKGGHREYILTKGIIWELGKKGSGCFLHIPKGREFESSVPKSLKWFWSPDDPCFLKAAAVHDYMLETGYRVHVADAEWLSAAMSMKAPRKRTELASLAMRIRRTYQWLLSNK